jgi:hypothetical protein
MWGKNIANSEFKMAEINSYLEGAKLNELKHIENKLNNLGLGDNVTFVLRSHLST